MIVVVAADESDVDEACAALGRPAHVIAPGGTRRLVTARVEDQPVAWRLASGLRDAGWAAVSRPESGPALERWRRDTDPITVGDAVTVMHACSEHPRDGLPGVVELGFGGFGNGRHPATRLVAQEMVTRLAGEERVLDVGSGSGVLGLGALRLGAGSVVATDIDPAAVEATRRNAVLNGMAERVEATGDALARIGDDFDVVVANIGRAAIVELAPALGAKVGAEGWLAVSGIAPVQCDVVAGFLSPLREIARRIDGAWAASVFDCPGGDTQP